MQVDVEAQRALDHCAETTRKATFFPKVAHPIQHKKAHLIVEARAFLPSAKTHTPGQQAQQAFATRLCCATQSSYFKVKTKVTLTHETVTVDVELTRR